MFASETVRRRAVTSGWVWVAIACVWSAAAQGAPPRFELVFTKDVHDGPFTGRVWVILGESRHVDPVKQVTFMSSPPIFAQRVENWRPAEPLRFEPPPEFSYPEPMGGLSAGSYSAQAVLGINRETRTVVTAPGNGISKAKRFRHDPDNPRSLRLRIRRTIPAPPLREGEQLRYVRIKSDRLSRFYGRDVYMRAAVGLPQSYINHPTRKFPTVYVVPGFDGLIYNAPQYIFMYGRALAQAEFDAVIVYLDADCPTGHHVFADSDNNGPVGTALVKELIPYLEKNYRLVLEPGARFVSGISSGGWSSLWLQVAYPDEFGGVWSISPDPVDFSAFQTVDIYDPKQNVLYDENGDPRLFMRQGWFGAPCEMKQLALLEQVFGRGGQMYSFDAVFSPRGPDGRPRFLWDRLTGTIDAEAAEAWRRYDIRLVLETNWDKLGPRLEGKLNLFCGDRDEFFLERAYEKLAATLRRLGSDARLELVPGGGHGLPPMVVQSARQMRDVYQARFGAEVVERGTPRCLSVLLEATR